MRALIFDGKIVDVVAEDFPVHANLHFIDCPDNCKAHAWTLVDGVPTAPTPKADDGLEWQRNRQLEYPNAIECVHALLDGGDTLTDLQAQRTTIKNKYPKP